MDTTVFKSFEKIDQWVSAQAQHKANTRGIPFKQALVEFSQENPAIMKLHAALYMQRERGKHDTTYYKQVDGHLVKIEEDIQALVQQAQRAMPGCSYGAALKAVASERPELFKEREELRQI